MRKSYEPHESRVIWFYPYLYQILVVFTVFKIKEIKGL